MRCSVIKLLGNTCHVERVIYIDVLVTCIYLPMYMYNPSLICRPFMRRLPFLIMHCTWENLLGISLHPLSLSIAVSLSCSQVSFCHTRLLSATFILKKVLRGGRRVPSYHLLLLPLTSQLCLVPRLLYKLLMTAKPNRENERACPSLRNYPGKNRRWIRIFQCSTN